MSRTVFILGAGASKQAGAPLMKDFLDVAEKIPKMEGANFTNEEIHGFEDVFNAINALQAAHAKASIDTDNVEDVFAAFEMATLVNSLGTFPQEKVIYLRKAMRIVIVNTLEKSVKFPVVNGRVWPPRPYDTFVSFLKEFPEDLGGISQASVITFNYDIALDFAVFRYGLASNYGLNSPPGGSTLKVFKLHGSLNWAKCESCNLIVPWHLSDYFRVHQFQPPELISHLKNAVITISKHLQSYKHSCGSFVEAEPKIVPPTWNKTEYRETLANVWRNAARELSEAENIIVIGYSLPHSDLFFKYLYTVGTLGVRRIKKFWVFNPDPSVDNKFRDLLRGTTPSRYEFFKMDFDDALTYLADNLKS